MSLAAGGLASPASGAVHARAGSGARDRLLRCTSLHLPGRQAGAEHRLVRTIGDGRLFAPTRQAMFFSRAGGSCLWRPVGRAKG